MDGTRRCFLVSREATLHFVEAHALKSNDGLESAAECSDSDLEDDAKALAASPRRHANSRSMASLIHVYAQCPDWLALSRAAHMVRGTKYNI